MTNRALVEEIDRRFEEEGMDVLERPGSHSCLGNLARPRSLEVAAAINRYRNVGVV